VGRFGCFGEQCLEDIKRGTPAYFCGLDDAGEDRDILRSVGAARSEAYLAEDDERSQRAFRVVVGGRPSTAHEGEDLLVFARSGDEPFAEGLGLGEVQVTCANQIEDAEETRLEFEPVGFRFWDLQGASPAQESAELDEKALGTRIGRLHRGESLRDLAPGAQEVGEAALTRPYLDGVVGGIGVGDEQGVEAFTEEALGRLGGTVGIHAEDGYLRVAGIPEEDVAPVLAPIRLTRCARPSGCLRQSISASLRFIRMDEIAVTHLFNQPFVKWVGTFAGALFKSEATGRDEVQSEVILGDRLIIWNYRLPKRARVINVHPNIYQDLMRQSRIRGTGTSYYHVISRIVDRRFILGDEEREHFVVLMCKLEAFLGLRVVTYVVMSNHFHLLVEEPDRDELPALDRETLLKRLGYLYDRSAVDTVRDELVLRDLKNDLIGEPAARPE